MNNYEDIIINKDININGIKNEKQNIIEFPPKKISQNTMDNALYPDNINRNKKKRKRKFKKKKILENNMKSITIDKYSLSDKKAIMVETKKNILENIDINQIYINQKSNENINNDGNRNNISNNQNLDDFYLNNLNYEKALELDKRKFIQIYWSKLKRKHIIIYILFYLMMIII